MRAGSILLANALNDSGLPVEARVHYFGWPKDESIFEGVDMVVVYADAGGKFGKKYGVLDSLNRAGVALMFLHYGTHPTKSVGEKFYKKWLGGYYDDSSSVNSHWLADLTPKAGHPVSNGIDKPIKVLDEFYWNLNFLKSQHRFALGTAIPTKDVMMSYGGPQFWNQEASDSLGVPQSLLFCHDAPEAGRGVGFTGGHYHHNWAIDGFRKLILNAIVWSVRLDVPSNGVPSKSVNEDELNANLNRPNERTRLELPSEGVFQFEPANEPKLVKGGRTQAFWDRKNRMKKK